MRTPVSRGWNFRATSALPANEETNSIDVSMLSAQAVVLAAKHIVKLVQQVQRLGDMGVGFMTDYLPLRGSSTSWKGRNYKPSACLWLDTARSSVKISGRISWFGQDIRCPTLSYPAWTDRAPSVQL